MKDIERSSFVTLQGVKALLHAKFLAELETFVFMVTRNEVAREVLYERGMIRVIYPAIIA